jgi:(p)ppGpp synthase/HD superfamily hydrolase
MSEDTIFKAVQCAVRAHSGQFRKGTRIPYIIHPLRVAETLIEYDCSEEVVIAGILHDTIEDTAITVDDIVRSFGEKIADLVVHASEPDKSDTWENRKQHTIEYLKDAPMDVLLITCADKLDNLRSIQNDYVRAGEAVWSRFNRPKDYQRWYYQALADVFMSRIDKEPGASLFKNFNREVEDFFGKAGKS